MNQEKLNTFIKLIDHTIAIAEERLALMKTDEFIDRCYKSGWFTDEDMLKGRTFLEQKHKTVFHYLFLERNIIQGMKDIKTSIISGKHDQYIEEKEKGKRGTFGMTRGMADYERLWADELYDYSIHDACAEVEKYYNRELE